MEVGFKTDRGLRRGNNEDACYVMLKDKVFIVADGVGGNNSGEIASRTCVDEIARYIETHDLKQLQGDEEIRDFFINCIKDVNFKILEFSQRHEESWGMATTVVLAHLRDGKAYIFNVGDSRGYILRGDEMRQITEDHTYVNSLVKAGVITAEEAETHENRNMITRAVGADYRVETDFFVEDIQIEDRILLCTDGLYGEVGMERLIAVLREDRAMTDVCDELVEAAKQNGGHDNITMVAIKVTEEDVR